MTITQRQPSHQPPDRPAQSLISDSPVVLTEVATVIAVEVVVILAVVLVACETRAEATVLFVLGLCLNYVDNCLQNKDW